MPLSNLLKPADGTSRYCGKKAGIWTWDHPECQRAHQAGRNEIVDTAANRQGFLSPKRGAK